MENAQNPNMEQIMYQFQVLRDRRDALAQNLAIFNASLRDHTNTKATLVNIKNTSENDEIILPIGSTAYIKGKISEPEKILVNVCQDITIEKDLDSAIEFITKIINQHTEQINLLNTNLYQLDMNLQTMSQIIQRGYPKQ